MIPQPISPYAVAKLTGEKYCHVFSRTYGLETVALRYFNVFGPRQDPQSQYSAGIPRFIVGMMEGQELTIHGDGSQSRDFTYVSNVVEPNLLAVHAEGVSGEAFNLACGASMSLNEVVEKIAQTLDCEGYIVYGPPRSGDVARSQADISRAGKYLGYEPLVEAREGLERVVLWFRQALEKA